MKALAVIPSKLNKKKCVKSVRENLKKKNRSQFHKMFKNFNRGRSRVITGGLAKMSKWLINT